jgi:hypothetical protein
VVSGCEVVVLGGGWGGGGVGRTGAKFWLYNFCGMNENPVGKFGVSVPT